MALEGNSMLDTGEMLSALEFIAADFHWERDGCLHAAGHVRKK
jgi:hypothetical protein